MGVGLLVALLAVVGPGKVVDLAGRVHPGWGAGVALLGVAWLCLGAVNVWILLRQLAPVPLRDFVGVYITSWATALAIPGQLGDAVQVVLLRRYDIPASRSAAAYAVDKGVSLTWLMGVAAFGVTLYLPRVRGWWVLVPMVLLLVAVWSVFRVLGRLRPGEDSFTGRVGGFARSFSRQVRSFRNHPAAVATNVGLTGIKWLVMASLYLGAFRAFGASVEWVAIATIPVIASLVGYLPVTVGGAGTMEWTAVALFGSLGVEGPTVVASYLFLRATLMAGAFLLLLGTRNRGLAEAEPCES